MFVDYPQEGVTTPVEVEFTRQSDGLAGKIGRQGDPEPQPLRKVASEGGEVTFEVSSPQNTGPSRLSLTLNADRLEGEMKGEENGMLVVGKVKFVREKKPD